MARPASGTVEWRGNPSRWFARVTVRDEHGVAHRPWVDLERPDLKNTPEDKKAAKAIARKRAKLAAKGTFVGAPRAAAPTVTLLDCEERWFALLDGDPDLKRTTRGRYKSSWATITKVLGKRPIASLDARALRQWIIDLRAKRSASTVRNDATALTRFFKDAIAQQWVSTTSNPMKDDYVRSAIPAAEQRTADEIVHLKRGALETLLASKLSDVHFGMLLVSTLTGVRAGELHGLRFQDAGVENGVRRIYVLQQLAKDGEDDSTKSRAGRRKVPLHAAAASWLAWWKATGWRAYVGREPEPHERVFPDADGEPWRPRAADLLRDLLGAAELETSFALPDGGQEPYTWHALRRSFRTMLRNAGVAREVRDLLLGHAATGVGAEHYEGGEIPLAILAEAVDRLELTLPNRPGVSPFELSRELSQRSKERAPQLPSSSHEPSKNTAEEKRFELLEGLHPRRFSKPVP